MSNFEVKAAAKKHLPEFRLSDLAPSCKAKSLIEARKCLLNDPEVKKIQSDAADAAYVAFQKKRFDSNPMAGDAEFKLFVTLSMANIEAAERGSAKELEMRNKLGRVLHQNPRLADKLTTLPTESGGVLALWGEIELPLKTKEFQLKTQKIRDAYGILKSVNDQIWDI